MKKIFTSVVSIIFLCPLLLFSQQYDKNWLLGYTGGTTPGFPNNRLLFKFTPNLVIDSMFALINQGRATITMSDKNGNFIFASNGGSIIDASGRQMINGDNLNANPCSTVYARDGSPIPQSILCLPAQDTSLYYLFHEPCDFNTPFYTPIRFLYSIVDMRGNNGLGVVLQKNVNLINDTLASGQITACKHSDGKSWWVFVPRMNSNIYYRILFSNSSIQSVDTIQYGTPFDFTAVGRATFSPDGKHYSRFNIGTGLSIMDFDRCTGRFSNETFKSIHDYTSPVYAGSVEFSPNSSLLYAFCFDYIYQYNLNATNIIGSELKVDSLVPYRCQLALNLSYGQLTPEGKILINSTNGMACVSLINYPDRIGTACNVIQHGLSLPMSISNFSTFPNNPHYRLGPDGQDCGINSLTELSIVNFSIYPNPATDYININVRSASVENYTFLLINPFGQEMMRNDFSSDVKEKTIDISELKPGVYIYNIANGNNNVSGRIVKL